MNLERKNNCNVFVNKQLWGWIWSPFQQLKDLKDSFPPRRVQYLLIFIVVIGTGGVNITSLDLPNTPPNTIGNKHQLHKPSNTHELKTGFLWWTYSYLQQKLRHRNTRKQPISSVLTSLNFTHVFLWVLLGIMMDSHAVQNSMVSLWQEKQTSLVLGTSS